MLTQKDVLPLLALDDQQFARAWRRSQRPIGWLVALAVFLCLPFVALYIFGLIQVWQGTGWFPYFWMSSPGIWGVTWALAFCALFRSQRALLYAPLAELRNRLRTDENVFRSPTRDEIAQIGTMLARLNSPEARARLWPLNKALISGTIAGLVVMALCGGLEVAQPHYFEWLYQRAHANQPVYTNPLSQADADWPATARTSFTDGALLAVDGTVDCSDEDSDDGNVGCSADGTANPSPLVIPSPRQMDNALYEVTVRTGSPLAVAFGGPGLGILTYDSGSDERVAIVFSMESDGSSWRLECDPAVDRYEHLFQPKQCFGSFNDLRQGDMNLETRGNATNRLAVLVSGGALTFYANGQYLGRYYNSDLVGGQIGLAMGGQQETAYFTDFAIYPL